MLQEGWAFPLDFGLAAGIVWALILAVGLVVTAILLPLVVFVVEAIFALVAVAVLLRPWRVEAKKAGPPAESRVWRVRGWKRSKQAVEEVRRELSLGVAAAPDEATR